jgi:hypothetical protein
MQKNSIMLSKGQRMSEVVLDNQGSSDTRRRRSRVGLLLSTAVVTALFCLCAAAQNSTGTFSDDRLQGVNDQNGNATATGQNGNAPARDQNGNAMATGQTGTAMETDQNGNAMATEQNGTAMAATPASMSADQIIGILQQQPDLLESMKAAAAQQTGVDPSTISNDDLYGQHPAGCRPACPGDEGPESAWLQHKRRSSEQSDRERHGRCGRSPDAQTPDDTTRPICGTGRSPR